MNTNNNNQDKIFTSAAIFFAAVGLFLIGLSIFYIVSYDKVEGEINIVRYGTNNGKHAHITYEYEGELYEDKGLSSYNGFTMKDGETYTVYVNPDKPESPKVTSFTMGILSLGLGIWVLRIVSKTRDASAGKGILLDKDIR